MYILTLLFVTLLATLTTAAPPTPTAIPPEHNPYDIAGHALMINSFPVALFVGDTCEETTNLLGHPIGNYGVLADHECQFFADVACGNSVYTIRGPVEGEFPEGKRPVQARCSRV